ncbi:unnamed protein product [Calypogeia fissa]
MCSVLVPQLRFSFLCFVEAESSSLPKLVLAQLWTAPDQTRPEHTAIHTTAQHGFHKLGTHSPHSVHGIRPVAARHETEGGAGEDREGPPTGRQGRRAGRARREADIRLCSVLVLDTGVLDSPERYDYGGGAVTAVQSSEVCQSEVRS